MLRLHTHTVTLQKAQKLHTDSLENNCVALSFILARQVLRHTKELLCDLFERHPTQTTFATKKVVLKPLNRGDTRSPLTIRTEPVCLSLPTLPHHHLAMGQNPNRSPSEHPNPTTKIGSKLGGEFTYQAKWDPKTVLTPRTTFRRHLLGAGADAGIAADLIRRQPGGAMHRNMPGLL